MRILFTLCLLSVAMLTRADAPVLDTFLIGKASDKKFNCLLSVLDKINGDSKIIKDREDWSATINEGVQQGIDINTLLLQYQYFNLDDRNDIKSCGLSLSRATERCKSVYGECDSVTYNEASFTGDAQTEGEKLPFVTRRCPENYIRYGCCSCMQACSVFPELFTNDQPDIHGYCVKKAATVSHISNKRENDDDEPAGDKYVTRCDHGWARVGSRLCVPKCPLGWADHGDRCLKTAKINLMPFSWQPGDED
jgi:hypothetical protein